jgi:pyruvate kinase
MIARGDLGIENPIEEIAYIQKQIIEKCREKNVSVIVATQMLQSMVKNSRPTRAEATDVANAVFNETDAIMLSGETAMGDHPIRSVQTMNKIVVFNEDKKEKHFRNKISFDNHTELIVETTANILNSDRNNKIDKVIILTDSGYTARAISSHRLQNEIIAITKNELTRNMLKLSFGIVSYFINYENKKNKITHLINELKKAKIIEKGNSILLISGSKLDI